MRTLGVNTQGFRKAFFLTFVVSVAYAIQSSTFTASKLHAQWVDFIDATATHLDAPSALFTADSEEKDFVWEDFDQDGDIDLIIVRKQPYSTTGARTNVLLLNEGISDGQAVNGVLVDYTDLFATASTVPGDMGFNTPTNDRDVVAADINNDGWLDIITAVTLSDGTPRHIKMPRIYVNLGDDAMGDWQGFEYQHLWIPDMSAVGGIPANASPRFCSVAAADVDHDGDIDLYFGDYDNGATTTGNQIYDFNDRLLINQFAQGSSEFIDETAAHFPQNIIISGSRPFHESAFAARVAFVDINNDGFPDLIKQTALQSPQYIGIAYNDPNNPGMFINPEPIYVQSPYFFSVGDLNNDGFEDLVVGDDSADRILIHDGVNPDGTVDFNTYEVDFADPGFPGNSVIADLNNDGLKDAIIGDVDVDSINCSNPTRTVRNLGNFPNVTLQDQGNVFPITMTGVHDIAVFDLNGDGWNDVVLGRCNTGNILLNNPPIGLRFLYPAGLVSTLVPGQPTALSVEVEGVGGGIPVPGTLVAMVSVEGGPFTAATVTSTGTNLYSVDLPAVTCPNNVAYFFTAELQGGAIFTDPSTGAADPYLAYASLGTEELSDEGFEDNDGGWTVSNFSGLTTGAWERAEPIGTSANGFEVAPSEDASASAAETFCFVTENNTSGVAGTGDVDGGITILTSPVYDLAGSDAIISWSQWYISILGGTAGDDTFAVELSNNGGFQWHEVRTYDYVTDEIPAWTSESLRVSEHLTPTDQVQIRFVALDQGNASLVEAGIDNVIVSRSICGTPFVRGDLNADTSLDISDVISLLGHLFSAEALTCLKAGDANDDSALNVADAISLLDFLFSGGAPFPAPHGSCGQDATPDALTCDSFMGC